MNSRTSLLIRVSELYYQQELNQSTIGEILNISRPTVSRLLEEAKAEGIVKIIIHNQIQKDPALSNKLRKLLKLKEAIVVSGEYGYEEALQKCSITGANLLDSVIENNDVVGINWGLATTSLCSEIKPRELYNVSIVQMIGCLGTGNPNIDGLELAINIASKLSGTYSNIYAPAFVNDKTVYNYLMNEPQIKATLKKAAHADIILTGIGSLADKNSTLQKYGCITEDDRLEYVSKGGIAHLLGRAFDMEGNEISIPNKYVVSAPLDAFKNARWSICISASEIKALPIIAALNAGYLNTLVVDESLAKELIRIHNSSNSINV